MSDNPVSDHKKRKKYHMISIKFFPTLLIALDVLAAVGYGLHGWHEWRKIVYWLAAAVLTYTVTY